MTSRNHNIIIFGPTGAVGSATAIEAHRLGAKVWLAMRDINKPIKGLNDQESEGYERIHADLSKPETLKDAIKKSGATSAFTYCMLQSPDSMKSAFEAMKEAGVTYVALLSSFGIKGDARDEANSEHIIGRAHAKVEVALEDAGLQRAVVRPAYFNSNILWTTEGIKKGDVEVLYPKAEFDYISPSDIGTVCGALLADPEFKDKDEKGEVKSKTILLCGPKVMKQEFAYVVIGDALGHKIKVTEIDEETWYQRQSQIPRPVLETLAKGMKENSEGKEMFPRDMYDEASGNVKKYMRREPTSLGDWVKQNKDFFA